MELLPGLIRLSGRNRNETVPGKECRLWKNGTLNLDQNELQIIERGVVALNRAKRKLRTTRLVVWGALILFLIGSLIFVPMKYDLEEKLG